MIREIDVDRVDVLPQDRTRFDEAALDDLARSIAEVGLLSPVIVRPHGGDRYVLIAGERRLRAVRRLGWPRVRADVRELTAEQASLIQLTENESRQSLDPIERAHAYRRRLDTFGWTVDELAARAGVPTTTLRNHLDLLDVIPELQFLVASGQMGFTYARLVRGLDPERQVLAMRGYLDHPDIDRPTWQALIRKLRADQDAEAQAVMFTSDDFQLIAEQYVTEARRLRRPGVQRLLDLLDRAVRQLHDEPLAAEVHAALEAWGRVA